jgi:hypothetical protein
VWFKPDGKPMTDQDWDSRHARSLGVFLNGKAIPGRDEHGRSSTTLSCFCSTGIRVPSTGRSQATSADRGASSSTPTGCSLRRIRKSLPDER